MRTHAPAVARQVVLNMQAVSASVDVYGRAASGVGGRDREGERARASGREREREGGTGRGRQREGEGGREGQEGSERGSKRTGEKKGGGEAREA